MVSLFAGRRALIWMTALTFVHGVCYAAAVHPWQAPDEYRHYETLRMIDRTGRVALTVEDRTSALQWEIAESMLTFQHWRYRLGASLPDSQAREIEYPLGRRPFTPQAPLYYLVSLPLYWWLRATPVINQLYALRLLSIGLHCLTTLLTYLLARHVFGERSLIPVTATFVVALHPQYSQISASYNNDNLAPPLVTVALYALLKGLDREADGRWLAAALAAGGLALAAKRTAIGLVPVLAIGLILYGLAWLRSARRSRVHLGAAALTLVGLAALGVILVLWIGPRLPSSLSVALRLGRDSLVVLAGFLRNPSQVMQMDWRMMLVFFHQTFWAYIGLPVEQLKPGWYSLMAWSSGACTLGCLVGLVRLWGPRGGPASRFGSLALLLFFAGLAGTAAAIVGQWLIAPVIYLPQGRYAFPFISALAILAMWGWLEWWPARWRRLASALAMGVIVVLDLATLATAISFFYS